MKKTLYWIIAVVITLTAVVYQKMTGPTNPKRYSFELQGKIYDIKLIRSLDTEVTLEEAKGDYMRLGKTSLMEVEVKNATDSLYLKIFYRRYPSEDTIAIVSALRSGEIFTVNLPSQPPAGKLEYFAEFSDRGEHKVLGYNENLTIRFKNPVPAWALIPHILLMFIAMLLSTYIGVISMDKTQKIRTALILLILALTIGGILFGPIVQKFAFGEFWTGWPFGHDMTDNKTLAALLIWLVAIWGNSTKKRRWWYIVAAIFMLLIYSIPHSSSGSEYDYSKRGVVTGDAVNTCEYPASSGHPC